MGGWVRREKREKKRGGKERGGEKGGEGEGRGLRRGGEGMGGEERLVACFLLLIRFRIPTK